ncbi:tetratricopeptide repeat protein [Pseudoduganella lurida]|uniref:Tetratricopeptide repeat protein n=1 Tax=Pseudoduganella lurida TaxID=1036180 RepID=A0A562R1P0_9BURK|nr:tetratricopeptide repeat protein [Pseudoduganella lurida]TWI62978.1 tetratricopeptide repeat protein [Pseudoduganella lurida]
MLKRFPVVPMTLALLALSLPASCKPYCGELANAFGPFDYRTPPPDALHLVESAHYTEDVAQGVRGNTSTVGGDLDYTLRAFPNHAPALATLAQVALRTKATTLPGANYAVECYFERAVRFQPDDGITWGAYGQYLYRLGQRGRALPLLEKAAALAPDNASLNYNLGIAYAAEKRYDRAVAYAKKAYRMNIPLAGLRNTLVAAGQWDGKVEALPANADEAAR